MQNKGCCKRKSKQSTVLTEADFNMQNGRIVAVKNATFGLDKGECFVLLGVNGAGKTTCFKALTNEIVRTSGTIEIMGFKNEKNFSDAAQFIGYCP